MSNINRRTRQTKSTNRGKPNRSQRKRVGTVDRPPYLLPGTQEGRQLAPITKIYNRLFKYRVILSTVGGQTFFLTCIYTYTPFANTMINTGSIVVQSGLSPTAVDVFATFQYYRINKIFVAYTSVASTTIALPPIYASLQSGNSPFVLGTSANTNGVNSVQNSVQIDPHMSTSFSYLIPHASNISQLSGTFLDQGWIPSADGTSTPTSTTEGVIAFASGDGTLAAPLTTVFGALDVEYSVSFKLAE